MLEDLWGQFEDLLALGTDVSDVGVLPMALRTIVVYAFALAVVRIGSKRFLSKATPFDVLVAVMLGAIVGRAINGSAPFVPSLVGAGAVLIALHWLFARLAFHWDWIGPLIKGEPRLLVKDSEIQWGAMRSAAISERDLHEVLRLEGYPPDISLIKTACLERNGDISLLTRETAPHEPRVLDVKVENGVQTVRIEVV